ncbi:MAG TPA: GntR family transcriptional regulator [Gemmatimonadales bacterium]|nr:GntR family transcriptional regulator [Gemmatimonadales bacterium]
MTKPGSGNDSAKLSIQLDPGSALPLYRQIVDQIWVEVVDGSLAAGERMPTLRQLAIALGVHPDTVARAYHELALLGVLRQRRGEGTFVGLQPTERSELDRRRRLEHICVTAVADAKHWGFSPDDMIEIIKELRDQRGS